MKPLVTSLPRWFSHQWCRFCFTCHGLRCRTARKNLQGISETRYSSGKIRQVQWCCGRWKSTSGDKMDKPTFQIADYNMSFAKKWL